VHVFNPDFPAIGLPQDRDDLAQGGPFAAEQVVDKDLATEIALGETVAAVIELGVMSALVEPQRVKIGFEVTPHPVGSDQLKRPDRVSGRLAECLLIDFHRRRRAVTGDWRCGLRPMRSAQLGKHR